MTTEKEKIDKSIGIHDGVHRPIYEIEKERKPKSLYDYKLGEINPENMMNGIMEAPNKLVKISYTFQDKNGAQMDCALKHKDFIEDEEEMKTEKEKNNSQQMPIMSSEDKKCTSNPSVTYKAETSGCADNTSEKEIECDICKNVLDGSKIYETGKSEIIKTGDELIESYFDSPAPVFWEKLKGELTTK